MDYCSVADLHQFGVAPGKTPNPARLATDVSSSADTIELDDHGFALNAPVSFRADAGGSLPSPLVAGRDYFAIPLTDGVFRVAAAADGPAIDLTTAGESVLVIAKLDRAAAITWASSLLDDMIPAAVVPLTDVPPIVRMTCAELAAGKLVGWGVGSLPKTLSDALDAASKRMARWAAGVAPRGTATPVAADLSQSAASAYYPGDTRGWSRFGGIG